MVPGIWKYAKRIWPTVSARACTAAVTGSGDCLSCSWIAGWQISQRPATCCWASEWELMPLPHPGTAQRPDNQPAPGCAPKGSHRLSGHRCSRAHHELPVGQHLSLGGQLRGVLHRDLMLLTQLGVGQHHAGIVCYLHQHGTRMEQSTLTDLLQTSPPAAACSLGGASNVSAAGLPGKLLQVARPAAETSPPSKYGFGH